MIGTKLKRILPEAILPTKATEGSAYYDLYVAEEGVIRSGEVQALTTGWLIEVPPGFFLDVRSRSGMSLEGLMVANAPGTVDEDYRGELRVILYNSSEGYWHIHTGDRVAQCALMPVIPTSFEEVKVLSETIRGDRGYGSSGR